jgi:periplasmic protein TonB
MFDQTFVDTSGQTRRPWTVAVSLTLQIALVAVALIVPLLHVASLDLPVKIRIQLPLEKADLKARPEPRVATHQALATPRLFDRTDFLFPTVVPAHIDPAPEAPELGATVATTSPTGSPLGGLLPSGGIVIQPPPAPVVKLPPPLPSVPLQVGGDVQAGKLLFGPKPAYPPLAKTTRTQGTVRVQAVIARDGAIKNLELISGPPLLVAAAMEAVRQWRYKPTLLNGEPVEVITVVDVNFTLSQ